jgi:hypothetical protein
MWKACSGLSSGVAALDCLGRSLLNFAFAAHHSVKMANSNLPLLCQVYPRIGRFVAPSTLSVVLLRHFSCHKWERAGVLPLNLMNGQNPTDVLWSKIAVTSSSDKHCSSCTRIWEMTGAHVPSPFPTSAAFTRSRWRDGDLEEFRYGDQGPQGKSAAGAYSDLALVGIKFVLYADLLVRRNWRKLFPHSELYTYLLNPRRFRSSFFFSSLFNYCLRFFVIIFTMEPSSTAATAPISKTSQNDGDMDFSKDEKTIGHTDIPSRPKPTRQVSEWEALQIVAAGDMDTINREMDEIEAELQAKNITSTWLKPQLRLKDPRYFTWLLVGM